MWLFLLKVVHVALNNVTHDKTNYNSTKQIQQRKLDVELARKGNEHCETHSISYMIEYKYIVSRHSNCNYEGTSHTNTGLIGQRDQGSFPCALSLSVLSVFFNIIKESKWI
jgi:hypothetical protein